MSVKKQSDMHVLILDDEDQICELMTIFLEKQFEFKTIVSATTKAMAIQKMMNQNFDIAIVDLNLQGSSGLEFIEYVKSSGKSETMKVILISGYFTEQKVLTAIKNGVKHILVKPFTRQQLISEVSKALNLNVHQNA